MGIVQILLTNTYLKPVNSKVGLTYGRGDVEAAEVGGRPIVDLSLGVEPAIAVVCGGAPHAAPVGQAI